MNWLTNAVFAGLIVSVLVYLYCYYRFLRIVQKEGREIRGFLPFIKLIFSSERIGEGMLAVVWCLRVSFVSGLIFYIVMNCIIFGYIS